MGRNRACAIAFLFVVVTVLCLWATTSSTKTPNNNKDDIVAGKSRMRWFWLGSIWSDAGNSITTENAKEGDGIAPVVEETDTRTANNNKSDARSFSTEEIVQMKHQLRPQVFRTTTLLQPPYDQGSTTTATTGLALLPHQFFHLHHMKTGGTSMDSLINCGLTRMKKYAAPNSKTLLQVNYTNIHECGESNYIKCKSGENAYCLQSVQNAAIMSYCAPLKDLHRPFSWEYLDSKETKNDDNDQNTDIARTMLYRPAALTVFRHPVARVWSMFRFQTKSCYGCRELKDIYRDIDQASNNLTRICKLQLLNHQTRNLMSSDPENEIPSTEEHLAEAIANMKNVFTMIGLTEDMPNTTQIAGRVFPWLAERVTSWSDVFDIANQTTAAVGTSTTDSCVLPHRNASPKNNRCIDNTKHWDLPDIPDEETTQAIMEHNQLDMRLYEAAVRQFELQKIALGLHP
jgi:hypothetical protein